MQTWLPPTSMALGSEAEPPVTQDGCRECRERLALGYGVIKYQPEWNSVAECLVKNKSRKQMAAYKVLPHSLEGSNDK